jgi:Bacterial mobilisation protein (MobC)
MASSPCVQCRVSPETKKQLQALAHKQQLTESALLKRLVEVMVHSGGDANSTVSKTVAPVTRGTRIYVRLQPADHLLLRERALARGMAAATYASLLLRAHLRNLAPLPKDELTALMRSTTELRAVGRNLNQIARAANQGSRVNGPSRDDLLAVLRACEGLRVHTKALLQVNLHSWETGYAEAHS